jgi:hypothetical protein
VSQCDTKSGVEMLCVSQCDTKSGVEMLCVSQCDTKSGVEMLCVSQGRWIKRSASRGIPTLVGHGADVVVEIAVLTLSLVATQNSIAVARVLLWRYRWCRSDDLRSCEVVR